MIIKIAWRYTGKASWCIVKGPNFGDYSFVENYGSFTIS